MGCTMRSARAPNGASVATLHSQKTPLGTLLQALAIHDLAITVQHPMAMLWAACNASVEFASFFASVLDRDNNIVKIALYSDEISPSSQLDKPDERKTEAVYWSIIGFGPMALAHEEFWLEASLLRSEREHQIRGGLSRLFKYSSKAVIILKFCFSVKSDL